MEITSVSTSEDDRAAAKLSRGLPSSNYRDQAAFDDERWRIFRSAWHYAGPLDHVRRPGDFFTVTLDNVGTIVCNHGQVEAFVNACLHRCHEVATGAGTDRYFRCRYHGWTYSLDGRLLHAPGSTQSFPVGLHLRPLAVGVWGPLVFVCPGEPRLPFETWFAPVARSLSAIGLEPAELRYEARDPWSFRANWKIGIENFLECYHCPATHPDLSSHIEVGLGAVQFIAEGCTSTQIARPRRHTDSIFRPFVPIGEARYHFLWPTTTITVNPGLPSLLLNAWRPEGPRQTNGFEDAFFAPTVPVEYRMALTAYSTRIGDEDAALVESVQRGIDSLPAAEVRLLDREECLIEHFHSLVHEAIPESERL